MFDFGRDLIRRLGLARRACDLSWVELINADLLCGQARRQATDAGRVSCRDPHAAWMMATEMWAEHARRTGSGDSVDRAGRAAEDALAHARDPADTATASLARVRIDLLRFDLFGSGEALTEAARRLLDIEPPTRSEARVHRELTLKCAIRRGVLEGGRPDPEPVDALSALSECVEDRGSLDPGGLALEAAALQFELGLHDRDPARLERAGARLGWLIDTMPADYRPLTRARALAVGAQGTARLAALSANPTIAAQARDMFDAAAAQFTLDHSPLDWCAIQIARALAGQPRGLNELVAAERASGGRGLILGAMARERRAAAEVGIASSLDGTGLMVKLRARVRQRLRSARAETAPLDWVADQITLGRLALSGQGGDASDLIVALVHAREVCLERGATVLANQADELAGHLKLQTPA